MKFAFLILHYKNSDVTIQCIESIESTLATEQYDIVVVDNASNNGSYEELTEHFKDRAYIHFLHNEKNLGYAAGNNIGFRYAKHILEADWICLANNDVIFQDAEWIDKVLSAYQNSPFYVLGPDIVTPQGEHQNPFRNQISGRKEVCKSLVHDVVVYWLLVFRVQRKLRNHFKQQDIVKSTEWNQTKEDFKGVLHGSCLVFSPEYVEKFDGLYGGTFLYCEEEILCYILQKLGFRYMYCKDLQVVHRHATSFTRTIQDEDARKKVIVRNRIRSYQKFLQITFCKGDLQKYLTERG